MLQMDSVVEDEFIQLKKSLDETIASNTATISIPSKIVLLDESATDSLKVGGLE